MDNIPSSLSAGALTGINYQQVHEAALEDTFKAVYAFYNQDWWEFTNPLHTESNCKELVEWVLYFYNQARSKYQPPLGF